jgi:hypothetical protein
MAKQNWPDSVRQTLAPLISAAYGIRPHTPVVPNDANAFRFRWNGSIAELWEQIPAGKASFGTMPPIRWFCHILTGRTGRNLPNQSRLRECHSISYSFNFPTAPVAATW